MKKRIFAFIKHSFAFVFFIILGFGLSYLFYLWVNYPGGLDAFQHAYRLKTIAQFWPHHTWLHTWAGGMPHFLVYPTLPYFPAVLLLKLTGWTPYFILYFSEVFTFGLLAFSLYLLIYVLTRHWFLSLLSGILVLGNFGSWHILLTGVFARMWATPFMVFSWIAFLVFLRGEEEKSQASGKWLIATVFTLGLTFSLHLFMGIMGAAIIGILTLFTRGFSWKSLFLVIRLGLLTFLLAATNLLPIIFLKPPGIWVGQDVSQKLYGVTDPKLLFYWHKPEVINPFPGTHSLAFYYPILMLLTLPIFLFFLFSRKSQVSRFYKGILVSFLLISLVFFVYNRVPLPILGLFYNQFLPYLWVLAYLAFFLTVFIILVLWLWLRKRSSLLNLVSLALIFGIFLAVFYQFNPRVAKPILEKMGLGQACLNPEVEYAMEIRPKLIRDEKAFNFRFGDGNYGGISVWFNLLFPFVPQTRDFFPLTIVSPDYYFYIIQAGWFQKDNFEETNFLFDWWGVREFVVMKKDGDIVDKFLQKPEFYESKGRVEMRKRGEYEIFEFKKATPILATNNSPAILIIGRQPESYNTVFRSLAYGNFNSRFAIPLEGKEFVDDYKLEELKNFPIVFLYQTYKWRNFEKASRLLEEYVSQGGRLVIEANRDLENKTQLPDIYPISRAEKESIESWELNGLSSEIEGIDFLLFDKAVYDGGPWGVMIPSEIKEDAITLITQAGKPVVLSRDLGQGKVIWSGINLPFHTTYYHNNEESKLIAKILTIEKRADEEIRAKSERFTSNNKGGLIYETSFEKVEFVNPEKRIIEVKIPTKGILFKESYFRNWKATVYGRKTPIYKTGAGFMYVPLEESKVGDVIVFEFKKASIQWVADGISILTLVLLILYALNWGIFVPLKKKVRNIIRVRLGRIGEWWGEEEET